MAADLVVDSVAEVVAEEAEEAEEVDLVAEVVAEDLEVEEVASEEAEEEVEITSPKGRRSSLNKLPFSFPFSCSLRLSERTPGVFILLLSRRSLRRTFQGAKEYCEPLGRNSFHFKEERASPFDCLPIQVNFLKEMSDRCGNLPLVCELS